jgi:hypothetical protein
MDQKPDDNGEVNLSTKVDRRRPDRIEDVSPELIPLMRGTAPTIPDSSDIDPIELEGLAASTGVLRGVLIGAMLWTAIIIAAFVVYLTNAA